MSDPEDPGFADTAGPATEPTKPVPRVTEWSLDGYELGDVIGRGGMGEVLAARDQHIDREVAIKRLRTEHPSADEVARFLREAQIQARLDHPAIVPVHALGTDPDGQPYFTMKRLAGTTLAQKLAAGGPPQPALRAFVDVCFAIELAHTRGVVHRDLKPSNIMLGDYGDVYVIDWGVARVLGTKRTTISRKAIDSLSPTDTATGVMLGTPGYMAPEQMRGDDVGPPADVFALGAILFEILAGESLHPTGKAAIASTLAGSQESPVHRRPDRAIAPELDALCVSALAEDPEARPTARALAEGVQQYLDGDRDLERRRRLAGEQVANARTLLAAGQRSEAARAAGYALALDNGSVAAAELVTAFLLEPTPEIPPEVTSALAAEENRLDRERSRRAIRVFGAFFLWLPTVALLQIGSWPTLIALACATAVMVGLSWYNSRTGAVTVPVLMVANGVVALLFSRLTGSFLITPVLVVGIALAFSSRASLSERPWLIGLYAGALMAAPTALEALGVFGPTMAMTPTGMLNWGTVITSHTTVDLVLLYLANVMLVVILAMYSTVSARGRSEAVRRLHLQTWHLQQLLPRAATR